MPDPFDHDEMTTNAVWSGDGPSDSTYRYALEYEFAGPDCFGGSGERVLFIMMNPSYASETEWDNTVRRCAGYAHDWGFGGMQIGNLFAFRTPFPDGGTDKKGREWEPLWEQTDPVGPRNDEYLRRMAESLATEEVVCAWGNAGEKLGRGKDVLQMLVERGIQPKALKVNANGHPSHPLYLSKDLKPRPIQSFDRFRESSLCESSLREDLSSDDVVLTNA